MATHSSILAWEIPWTEEPGGLQSMGWKESDKTQRLIHHHHLLPHYSLTHSQTFLCLNNFSKWGLSLSFLFLSYTFWNFIKQDFYHIFSIVAAVCDTLICDEQVSYIKLLINIMPHVKLIDCLCQINFVSLKFWAKWDCGDMNYSTYHMWGLQLLIF